MRIIWGKFDEEYWCSGEYMLDGYGDGYRRDGRDGDYAYGYSDIGRGGSSYKYYHPYDMDILI